jgi:hypothetical protein
VMMIVSRWCHRVRRKDRPGSDGRYSVKGGRLTVNVALCDDAGGKAQVDEVLGPLGIVGRLREKKATLINYKIQ